MKWLAATNLCPESRGVLELVAWLGTHAEGSAGEDFRAVCVATDRDFFGVTEATRALVRERLDVALADTIRDSSASGVVAAHDVLLGSSVAQTLADEALRQHSVLVVGRRAERDSRRIVRLGGVVRRVLRQLTTPVAVVPADWQGEHAGRGPVLVAVDPSEPSLAAITFGERLAAELGRETQWVHVLPGVEELGVPYLASSQARERRREFQEAATRKLHDFLAARGRAPDRTRLVTGPPVEAILETADEVDAAVVVTGSRRLSAGERLLSASTGSELASVSPRVVAIVPPDLL